MNLFRKVILGVALATGVVGGTLAVGTQAAHAETLPKGWVSLNAFKTYQEAANWVNRYYPKGFPVPGGRYMPIVIRYINGYYCATCR